MSPRLRSGEFLGTAASKRCAHGLVLADVHYPAGARLPRHTHERPYFCLILSGGYTERYSRRSRFCRPEMLVYHPAGEQHTQEFHDSAVVSLNVEIGPEWLGRMRDFGIALDQPMEARGGRPVALAARIFEELKHDDDDSALAIQCLVSETLAAITPDKAVVERRAPKWLGWAREFLNDSIAESVSLTDVADEVGVHPVHLAAVFRRFQGCSVGEYVRRQRVELARQKLASAKCSLAQIASEAGFTDQSHFTRTFKRLMGVTPGRYRTFLSYKRE